MAKQAKQKEVNLTKRTATKFLRDILSKYETIEEARGRFMNIARREREGMSSVYEAMAARGISQKSAKTNIKIHRAMERIRGWLADLELEDRRMAQRLAKMQADKQQLSFFSDLKPPTKAEIKAAEEAKKPETGDVVGGRGRRQRGVKEKGPGVIRGLWFAGLAVPCRALRCRACPSKALPAVHRRALPHPAAPHHAKPGLPCQTSHRPNWPRRASPRLPRRAVP